MLAAAPYKSERAPQCSALIPTFYSLCALDTRGRSLWHSATAWTGDNRDARTCRCAFSSTHDPATARPETHLSPSRSAYSLRLHKNHTSLNCLGCTPTRHTSVTHVPPTSILVCLLLSSARAPHMGRWTRGTVYPPRSPIPRAAYASPPSSRLCLATPLPCVRSGPFVPFPKSTVRTNALRRVCSGRAPGTPGGREHRTWRASSPLSQPSLHVRPAQRTRTPPPSSACA